MHNVAELWLAAGDVTAWVGATAQWLRDLQGSWQAVADINDAHTAVHEVSLAITTNDGTVDLPFVVVADVSGDTFTEIRTYHSSWPYTGGHTFREPPVERRDLSATPQLFADYIERLTRQDIDPILASFSPDGYVREPSGNRFRYQGSAQRDAFYKGHIADAPPAKFDLRTCTNGSGITAVEYAFAYGDSGLVGGVCIMEHSAGKIDAIRITDDVGA